MFRILRATDSQTFAANVNYALLDMDIFDVILFGESAPTHIESLLVRSTVSIVAGLIGALIAFEFG